MPEQAPDKHPVMRAFEDLVRKLDNPSEQEKSQDIVGQGEAERPTSAKEPTIKNRASHHRREDVGAALPVMPCSGHQDLH